jgi:hypothetical protein
MEFKENDIVKIKSSLRFVVEDGPNNFNQYNLLEIGEDGLTVDSWIMDGKDIELVERPFTKSQLKQGYVMVDEEGNDWEIAMIGGKLKGIKSFSQELATINLEDALTENLESISPALNPATNIVRVYGFAEYASEHFDFSERKVIWERK